ncbi:MAG: hypothetical protein PHV34_19150 [Verrucomicrobiae bacterium]|nr:hypothetical protein [Verrucomicrobiae bacterium]
MTTSLRLSAFFLTIIFFAGCADSGTGQRVTIDAMSAGVGGTAAYFGGGKDPALTTAGAVGGFVVAEGFQAMAKSGRKKAYNSGLQEGIAVGEQRVLQGLWEQSNGLPNKKTRQYQTLAPTVTVPAKTQNGVYYDSHTPSDAGEKLCVPAKGSESNKQTPHYETVPSGEAQ